MLRKRVKSSVIAAIGYDERKRLLEVEFHTGSIYDYFDVSRGVHQALIAADSIGKYFNEVIKPNHQSALIQPARDE